MLLSEKEYTSIGGQAVLEGVMMRSPNAFVVAVRRKSGMIRLRCDQWWGFIHRVPWLKKPFLRGVLVLIETMMNGIVSLNYSANIAALDEEGGEKSDKKQSDSIGMATTLTLVFAFLLGIGLFVFLPHALTALLGKGLGQVWALEGGTFHLVDGLIKGIIFVGYIWLIGLFPDIQRVFAYHGAEHKSIATFEAGESLIVNNARKFSRIHPRCGTSFLFFLILVSIILFSAVFSTFTIAKGSPYLVRHVAAILFKIVLMFPIAGISYEIIKLAGARRNWRFLSWMAAPGLLLQRLTTREPSDEQLEVALASVKAVLELEEKFKLSKASGRVVTLKEVEINGVDAINVTNKTLKDFLE